MTVMDFKHFSHNQNNCRTRQKNLVYIFIWLIFFTSLGFFFHTIKILRIQEKLKSGVVVFFLYVFVTPQVFIFS